MFQKGVAWVAYVHQGALDALPEWAEGAVSTLIPGHEDGRLCTRRLWMLTAGTAPPSLTSRSAEPLVIKRPPASVEALRTSSFVVRVTFDQAFEPGPWDRVVSKPGQHVRLWREVMASSSSPLWMPGASLVLATPRFRDWCLFVTRSLPVVFGRSPAFEAGGKLGSLTLSPVSSPATSGSSGSPGFPMRIASPTTSAWPPMPSMSSSLVAGLVFAC